MLQAIVKSTREVKSDHTPITLKTRRDAFLSLEKKKRRRQIAGRNEQKLAPNSWRWKTRKIVKKTNETRWPKVGHPNSFAKKKKAKCKFPQNARPTAAIFGKNAHSFMLATVLDVANYGVVSNSAGKMPVENEAST